MLFFVGALSCGGEAEVPAAVAGSGGGSPVPGDLAGPIQSPNGAPNPTHAKAVVIWSVTATSPDYSVKFGEGLADGSGYSIDFAGPPPAEALNMGWLGVGNVVLYPSDCVVPDGRIPGGDGWPELDCEVLGISPQSVIYIAPGARTALPEREWVDAFPEGYTCGTCVFAEPGQGFDGFTPSSCADVPLLIDAPESELCNWT